MEIDSDLPDKEITRRYMLGKASDEESSELEQRLMTDKAFYEELSVVEDELIDDFLAGQLNADELEPFGAHFLASPEHRKKLEFSRALRKYISKNAGNTPQQNPIDPPPSSQDTSSIKQPSDVIPASRIEEDPDPPAPFAVSPIDHHGDPPDMQPFRIPPTPVVAPVMIHHSLVARMISNHYFRAAAILVVVCGAAFGIWRGFFYGSDLDEGVAGFKDLYKDHYPFEARITTLSTYAHPPLGPSRGVPEADDPNDPESIRRVELTLEQAAQEHPGPKENHALGEFYLAQKRFQIAISSLRKAADSDANNPEYRSDLGAAFLEEGKFIKLRGSTSPNVQPGATSDNDFDTALTQFDRALGTNPSLQEALFDRALTLQEEGRKNDARQAWQTYLDKDPGSGWAGQARANLANLDKS